jgi:hypothetical protein
MHLLELQDVREVRDMDEWAIYMASLENLLKDPFGFADGGADRVYQSYTELAKRMTSLVRQKHTQRIDELMAPWTPVIEIVIDIAGATLSIMGTTQGPIYKCAGDVSSKISNKVAPIVGRLIVRGVAGVSAQAGLVTSIDFMKRKMKDAKKQWADIQQRLKEISNFRELSNPKVEAALGEKVPTVNYQEIDY